MRIGEDGWWAGTVLVLAQRNVVKKNVENHLKKCIEEVMVRWVGGQKENGPHQKAHDEK